MDGSSGGGLAVPKNFFDILLRLASGRHDLPATAAAPQTEIRADPAHLPAVTAAGVLLFHLKDIAQPHVHRNLPSFVVYFKQFFSKSTQYSLYNIFTATNNLLFDISCDHTKNSSVRLFF